MKTLKQMKTQMQSQSGFTFIEVLISITILSVGILGLLSSTGSVSINQRNADNFTEATMIASDRMEEIKGLATNEPSGGIYGFTYFVNDQTGGFLNGFATPNNNSRSLTDTVNGFTRITTVENYPSSIWGTESFVTPDAIHMVEAKVDVSFVGPSGSTKNVSLSTVLQGRQFIQ
jgi:prepilin-type N-terminal cleavage/methylation domain-containing protein